MLVRILLVIGGALVILLLLPVDVKFSYYYQQGASKAGAEIRFLLGLVNLKWTEEAKNWRLTLFPPFLTVPLSLPFPSGLPLEKGKEEGIKPSWTQFSSSLQDWQWLISKALPYCRRILRFSRLDILSFNVELGTGDAAETGIIMGFIWGLLGILQQHHWSHRRQGKGGDYKIIPHFNRQVLNVAISGILRVWPGHIITVMGGLLFNILWEKGRKGVVKNGRTSNPGFNENCHGEY